MARPRPSQQANQQAAAGDAPAAYMPPEISTHGTEMYPPHGSYPPKNNGFHGSYGVQVSSPVNLPTASTQDGGLSVYPPATPQVGMPWSSSLFDCGRDETNAIMTAFFPCVTFGQIAEILDQGQTSCMLGSFMYILMAPALCTCGILSSNNRLKLRNKYNLVQAPAEDWIVHLFCQCCSLCQEYRELKVRGIDPSLGWMGYLAQQQQQTTMSPPAAQTMHKH